jgi:hypothetical protein
MDSVTRILTSGLFHESVSTKPLSTHKDRFKFFRKFAVLFAVQGALPGSLTPVANGKNLSSIRKLVLNILFGHLWVV